MIFDTSVIIRKRSLAVAPFLLCATLCGAASAETRPVDVCLAAPKGAGQFARDSNAIGVANCATVYTLLGKRQDPPRLEYSAFPPGVGIVLVLRFPDDGKEHMLKRIVAGDYDERLLTLVRTIQSDGRPVTLRILHEGNGHWNPWGIFHKGKDGRFDNRPEEYGEAWRHVVGVVRSVIPKETGQVTFDMNINRRSTEGHPLSFGVTFPGAEFVDSISISSYNRCGSDPTHTDPHSFAQEFKPAYDEVVKIAPKTMAIDIAETSTMDTCGVNKKEWFYDLFVAVENQFTRVRQITFFFEKVETGKASNNVMLHWELDPHKGEPAMFAELLAHFRYEMGMTGPPYEAGKQRGTDWDTRPAYSGAFSAPFSIFGGFVGVHPEFSGAQDYTHFWIGTSQAFMIGIPPFTEGWSIGPELHAAFNWTSDKNPGENLSSAGARLQGCKNIRDEEYAVAGKLCLYAGVEQRNYEFPALAIGLGGVGLEFGFRFSIGGDWFGQRP